MGVPVVLGGLVGSICFEDQATWYRTLRRPFWEPPPPVFGQVLLVTHVTKLPGCCGSAIIYEDQHRMTCRV